MEGIDYAMTFLAGASVTTVAFLLHAKSKVIETGPSISSMSQARFSNSEKTLTRSMKNKISLSFYSKVLTFIFLCFLLCLGCNSYFEHNGIGVYETEKRINLDVFGLQIGERYSRLDEVKYFFDFEKDEFGLYRTCRGFEMFGRNWDWAVVSEDYDRDAVAVISCYAKNVDAREWMDHLTDGFRLAYGIHPKRKHYSYLVAKNKLQGVRVTAERSDRNTVILTISRTSIDE